MKLKIKDNRGKTKKVRVPDHDAVTVGIMQAILILNGFIKYCSEKEISPSLDEIEQELWAFVAKTNPGFNPSRKEILMQKLQAYREFVDRNTH